MKTAEQIAQGHSLSTCRNCDCAMNGGVCKRIVGMLEQMMAESTVHLARALAGSKVISAADAGRLILREMQEFVVSAP